MTLEPHHIISSMEPRKLDTGILAEQRKKETIKPLWRWSTTSSQEKSNQAIEALI